MNPLYSTLLYSTLLYSTSCFFILKILVLTFYETLRFLSLNKYQ